MLSRELPFTNILLDNFANIIELIYNIINTEYQMYLPLQILLHKLTTTNINLQYHKYRISRELTFTNITPPPEVNSACCNSSWAKRKRKSKMIWCFHHLLFWGQFPFPSQLRNYCFGKPSGSVAVR